MALGKRIAVFVITVFVGLCVVMPATPVYAASSCKTPTFLGMPAWYRGLQKSNDCSSLDLSSGIQTVVLTVALNILQAAMTAVAYIVVGFIIKGGYMYMTSSGDPQATAKAKNTIRDALIGLVIAVAAAAIVNVISGIV